METSSMRQILMLGFRPAGAPVFGEVEMQREADGMFSGIIPASATAGWQVEYYIEARRPDGKRLLSRGSSVDPIIVVLSDLQSDSVVVASEAAPREQRRERRFVLALLAGTGLGWTSGVGEVRQVQVTPSGIAWASLGHVAPEVGYFVTPNLMVAAQGRFQLVSGAAEFRPSGVPSSGVCGGDGVCSPAKAAFAGFLKGAWFVGTPASSLRPYVSLSVGGGIIRHVAQAGDKTDCGPSQQDKCLDTVAGGPFLFGSGVGLSYRLSESLAMMVALDGLAGVPKLTIQGDASLGIAFGF
jgi:hypothetical protein